MNSNNNIRIYREEELNWTELQAFGIFKDELAENGILETLLSGDVTEPIQLHISTDGMDAVIEATLQVKESSGKPIVEIVGINADEVVEN